MRAVITFVTMLGLSALAAMTVFALVFDPSGILWIVAILPMVGFLGKMVSDWSGELTEVSTAIRPLTRRANQSI